ncbi:MAG: hypothetical protein IJ597_05905, partial [Synergistaceae bacterium]|nr:hypothetical protein [Synergistaceae bacterium]
GVGEHVDIELAENGSGQCYIPGTSLAGAIRSWCERHIEAENFFGDKEQDASRIYINDSVIHNVLKERRHGISIYDETGTVFGREGFFYTRALLPRGTSIPFNLELDITDENDVGVLSLIIKALEAGKIRLGGYKARGMGKVVLKDVDINYYDFLGDNSALDLWLDNKPSSVKNLDKFDKLELKNEKFFHVAIFWKPEADLIVKSGRDGIKTKILPLVSGVDEGGRKVAPVIPGSSLKGIFRSHAKKILNTIFSDENNFEIIDDMFGNQEKTGRIMIDDVYCLADTSVNFEDWLDENDEALDIFTSEKQHVAIDRFTGGASGGALYNARPVKKSSLWEPINITLNNFPEISQDLLYQELALLKLLIRDFSEGYISIGFGSNRGLGKIAGNPEIKYDNFPTDEELQESWNKFNS